MYYFREINTRHNLKDKYIFFIGIKTLFKLPNAVKDHIFVRIHLINKLFR